MNRYYVTVRTPDGVTLINRMLCDCVTRAEAIRAGRRATVEQVRFDAPGSRRVFVDSLNVETVEAKRAR